MKSEIIKQVGIIPTTACFAGAPEWEPAIAAAIKVWLRPASIGDRRVVIDIFNAMMVHAPASNVTPGMQPIDDLQHRVDQRVREIIDGIEVDQFCGTHSLKLEVLRVDSRLSCGQKPGGLTIVVSGKQAAPAKTVDPVVRAWAKVSNISGQINGLSMTENCGLQTERLEPLGFIVPVATVPGDIDSIALRAASDITDMPSHEYLTGGRGQWKASVQCRVADALEEYRPAGQIPRAALNEFCDKFCGGKSELVATAESAFYAFNKALIATPHPGIDDKLDAKRYRYLRNSTEFTDDVNEALGDMLGLDAAVDAAISAAEEAAKP